MRFLISFLIISLCACGQQTKTNPQAKHLTDSAVIVVIRTGDYEKALTLIDEALKIDSNYLAALKNKFAFQLHLEQIDKAIETAKQMKRIKPDVPDYSQTVGMLYEKIGDSISAEKYFTEASTQFDNILKTTSSESKNYTFLLINKAINLVLLGKQQEGNDILKQLYEKEKDETYKEYIAQFMGKSRKEIIDFVFNGGAQSSTAEYPNDK